MSLQVNKSSITSHKLKVLLYGASGSGKTTFAGTAKDVIFLSSENGLLSIAEKGVDYIDIKSYSDLQESYKFLKENITKYKTVIIDSVTEINEIIKLEIENKTGKTMQIKDWGDLSKQIRLLLRSFRNLDMHCIFICQEATEKDSEEGQVSKRIPSLNGKNSTEISYFMDIVAYTYIGKDGSHKITTTPDARLLTKDRTGTLGNNSPLDFEKWIEIFKTKEIKDKEELVAEIVSKENKENEEKTYNLISSYIQKAKDLKQLENYEKIIPTKNDLNEEQKESLYFSINEKKNELLNEDLSGIDPKND